MCIPCYTIYVAAYSGVRSPSSIHQWWWNFQSIAQNHALVFPASPTHTPNLSTATTRSNDNHLNKRLQYVSRTWINSVVWPPECWSVYYQSVRTNNDLEGWHNRPNSRCRAGMNMYNAGEVAPRGIVQDSSPSSAGLPRKATATVLHSNYWEHAPGFMGR